MPLAGSIITLSLLEILCATATGRSGANPPRPRRCWPRWRPTWRKPVVSWAEVTSAPAGTNRSGALSVEEGQVPAGAGAVLENPLTEPLSRAFVPL